MDERSPSLEQAAQQVDEFGVGPELTERIAALEVDARQRSRDGLAAFLDDVGVRPELFTAARVLKVAAAQINVVIHAVGILVSLPYILEEDEIVEQLSLGAGNTGREHDLETDRRIAEFKFIDWRGGSETIRQNNVFSDVFSLAARDTSKQRILYVLGTERPLRFLRGGRALSSVLSRSPKTRREFEAVYGEDSYRTVGEYWKTIEPVVEVRDLREFVPELA